MDDHSEAVLSEPRVMLLQAGLNPENELHQELMDIVSCVPSEVARNLRLKDYQILSQFLAFPRLSDGRINLSAARKILADFLTDHPAFRSCDAEFVCQCITAWFMHNPDSIQNETIRQRDPQWLVQLSGGNTPKTSSSNSPFASPTRQRQLRNQPQLDENAIL